jgi:hypothetical protein
VLPQLVYYGLEIGGLFWGVAGAAYTVRQCVRARQGLPQPARPGAPRPRPQPAPAAQESQPDYEWDPLAFWLFPDWSGGRNLRDPGAQPFWMLPPKRPPAPPPPLECLEVRAARRLLLRLGRKPDTAPGTVVVESLGPDVLITYVSTASTTPGRWHYQASRTTLDSLVYDVQREDDREMLRGGSPQPAFYQGGLAYDGFDSRPAEWGDGIPGTTF